MGREYRDVEFWYLGLIRNWSSVAKSFFMVTIFSFQVMFLN